MKTYEILMPDFWACYLINGDASGFEPGEQEACDAYIEEQRIQDVFDVSEESDFSWAYGLHGGEAQGGNLATYVVTLKKVENNE